MDDGDIDEIFEYFCENILPNLDIDADNDDLVAKAYQEWMDDFLEDFYTL